MKKPAKKSTKKTIKSKKVQAPAKLTGWGKYKAEREQFFVNHPNSRVIIGIFIVSVSVLIGSFIIRASNMAKVESTLIREGIPPSYAY